METQELHRGRLIDHLQLVVRDLAASRRFYEAVLAVVGGLGGFSTAARTIGEAFGDWAGEPSPPVGDIEVTNSASSRHSEAIPDKSQADIALGLATIPRGNPDYYALDVANLILGRLGLMGRLGAEVRDLQGLAYYVYSQLEPRADEIGHEVGLLFTVTTMDEAVSKAISVGCTSRANRTPQSPNTSRMG